MEQKKLPDDFWTTPAENDPLAQNPDVGADLEAIEAHQTELGGIVEQMWKDMVNETKILEGTEIVQREELENPFVGVPTTERVEKRIQELSIKQDTKE